jgi:hypothetical protein
MALCSISADTWQADDVLHYLSQHGQHVNNFTLSGDISENAFPTGYVFSMIPAKLQQLSSLQLSNVDVQLKPKHGMLGIAGLTALKRLCLNSCHLYHDEELTAMLYQLSATLEHLSIECVYTGYDSWQADEYHPKRRSSNTGYEVCINTDAFQNMQHLTYLSLCWVGLQSTDSQGSALQPPNPRGNALQSLHTLTSLVDLRLDHTDADDNIFPKIISGNHKLTRLEVSPCFGGRLQPAVLAGKTQLQHLKVEGEIAGGSAGMTVLLCHLQHLQQLTYLNLHRSLGVHISEQGAPEPAAAAYAAITASSRLQHLDISQAILPTGVWQHVLPTDRQLPHLRELHILQVAHSQSLNSSAAAPEGSRLVKCCPGLQFLDMRWLWCSAELLAPLTGLTGLNSLRLTGVGSSGIGIEAVCQLTGLRKLEMPLDPSASDKLQLLQLTHLVQLTKLEYAGPLNGQRTWLQLRAEVCFTVTRSLCLAFTGFHPSLREVRAMRVMALSPLGYAVC